MLCDFTKIDYNVYQCQNCGTTLLSTDGYPPIFICNLKLQHNEPMPSFIDKVKNFTKSSIEHISNGMKLASDETISNRYDTCTKCEFFNDGTCSQCGCPLFAHKKYISKLSWAEQECPVGKWGKEST